MNWDKPFIRSVLSDSDGTGSCTRVAVLLVVIASLSWVTYLTICHKELPDLGRVAEFTTLVCGSLYGINKAASVFQNRP